jgi:hypothetical protein
MLGFLLVISALLAQDVSVLPGQGGTVTGVLRNAEGAPAPGVRVAALARPEAIKDLASTSTFAGLTETDTAGRYRLENIPPGRYYIVAGRIDAPTYYPGTVQASEGTVVLISTGVSVSSIDFVLNNGSIGRANGDLSGGSLSWVIPIQTRIEGGGKLPLFAAGRFPELRFTRSSGARIDVSWSAPNVTLSEPGYLNGASGTPGEYRVTIENLPDGYDLKSLTFGSTDLRTDPLQLPRASAGSIVKQNLVITLSIPPRPPASGVRVTGRIGTDVKRSIYISGHSGVIYSDGTFEFVGVLPGRHEIVTLDNVGTVRMLGASLVVGDQDILNIDLEDISAAPANSNRPAAPGPAGNHRPGSRIPTSSIHGRVSDGTSHEPFNAGKVVLNGNYSIAFSLNDDGTFEIPKLLSGSYDMEVIVFGIGALNRTVVLDEQDTTIELNLTP